MAGPIALELRAMSKRFGATVALAEVSLSVEAGQVHAVLGENGAGKSTLMKILAGAERPDSGAMRLDGADYAPANPAAARRAGVAMVHQEPLLCPHLTVAENIALGAEPARWSVIDRRALKRRVMQALSQVQGEESIEPDALTGELAAGTRQLVSIARALYGGRAKVIILDEPTSFLTAPEAERLFAVIRALADSGAAVLYISHFLEEVARIADAYTVLRDGKSVARGPIEGTPLSAIVEAMAGGQVQRAERSLHQPGEVVLRVEALAGRDKPRSATLTLRRGEVFGVAGLCGSGRTELLRAIFGLDAVVRGQVKVGAVAGAGSPALRLAQGVGLLSEDRQKEGLALGLSIADNMTLSKLAPVSKLGWLGPLAWIAADRQRAAAAAWIERLAIRCRDGWQPCVELSGGNQQKVALARLLHHGVDVALLDEPTRGIDVRSRQDIYRVIDELARAGKAVLMVSSQLPELLATCDRIAVMRRGVLGPAREIAGLDEHALLMEATGAV